MSTRNRHPAANFNLPPETIGQLVLIARYHGLGSKTAAVRWLAMREARKLQAIECKQPASKK